MGDTKVAIDPAYASVTNFSDCWMAANSPELYCANNHFASSDEGKVIAVYDAGLPGAGHRQPLATTIQTYVSPSHVTLAANSDPTINLTQNLCNVVTATWTPDGNVAVTCSAPHGFTVGQTITFAWTNDLAVDGWDFTISSIINDTQFVATGNGYPDGTHTFGSSVNGNPVICSGRSPRVVWGTDNTATIQEAVDSRAMTSNDDQTGAEIYFPPGHYLTHGVTLTCSFVGYNSCTKHYQHYWLHGAGRDTTILENWDPNQCLRSYGSTGSPGCAIIDAGHNDTTHNASGSYYYHSLQFRISGLSLIQVKNATAIIKALGVNDGENAEIDDNFFSNYSYEALYVSGRWMRIHDNTFRSCGLGGPSYAMGSSCINTFGFYIFVYNNRAENFGVCTEATLREGVFSNNFCGHVARKGIGFSIGSDPNGVWNMVVSGNTFKNLFQGGLAYGSSGSRGSMDRLHIVHNTFINSPGITLGDSAMTNYPGMNPDLNPTNFNEFSHNALSFAHNYGASNVYGIVLRSTHVPWVVDNNTIIRDFPPLGAPGYTIDVNIGSNTRAYWQASTRYSNGSYRQRIRPRPDNDVFQITSTGTCTSGATEPAWATTTPFVSRTTDGTCTWTYQGKLPVYQLSNNRIVGQGFGSDNAYCAEITLDWVDPEVIEMENNSISYSGGCEYQRTPNRPAPDIVGSGRLPAQMMRLPANKPISNTDRYPWFTYQTWQDIPPIQGYWRVGDKANKYKPLNARQSYWLTTREGYAAPVWDSGHSYSYMSLVVPVVDNGHLYANVAGSCISGRAQPNFPSMTDATVTDNTCTWREVGAAAAFSLF